MFYLQIITDLPVIAGIVVRCLHSHYEVVGLHEILRREERISIL